MANLLLMMPADAATPPRGASRWMPAAALVGLGALPAYVQVLPVFRDALQSYYGISITQFGLLLSVGLVPGALGALVAGSLLDRWGPRPVLRVSLAGAGLGMALVAAGSRWGLLMAALALASAFAQPLNLAIQAHLARRFPGQERRALSLNLLAASAAGVLYPLAAESLLSAARRRPGELLGLVLRAPFLVLAVPLLAAGGLYRASGKPVPPAWAAEPAGDAREPREFWQSAIHLAPGSPLLLLLVVAHVTADNAVAIWIPRVLESDSFAARPFAPGWVMSAYAMAYVVSRAGLAALPDGVGRRWLLVAPGLLGGSLLLAGLAAGTQALAAAGFVAGAFCWSVEYPSFLALLARRDPARLGTLLAAATVGGGVASFALANAMGWWAGRLQDAELWRILLLPAPVFLLIGVGGAVWGARYAAYD